ncbi:MAG: hypothetical protein KDD77_00265 [Caldilineaceae bacterium]|nr:hypothetical protein [Caldilineaceae bacterium]
MSNPGAEPCVERLNDYDLTVSHWTILDCIHRCGQVEIPDLVSKAPADHATTVEIVTGLAKLGYIGAIEEPGPLDAYSLVATPVGQYVWRRIHQTLAPEASTETSARVCAA